MCEKANNCAHNGSVDNQRKFSRGCKNKGVNMISVFTPICLKHCEQSKSRRSLIPNRI